MPRCSRGAAGWWASTRLTDAWGGGLTGAVLAGVAAALVAAVVLGLALLVLDRPSVQAATRLLRRGQGQPDAVTTERQGS